MRSTGSNSSDVLVVGAGPIGLFAALLLAKRGLRVTVVERYPKRLRAPKAHVVNPRSLEIFRANGVDVSRLRELASPIADSGHVRFVSSLAGRQYGSLLFERQEEDVLAVTPTPLINLRQPFVEDYLEELACRQTGITFDRPAIWQGVEQRDGICRSTILADGRVYEHASRYVIACDGAESTVREALGISMDGSETVQHCFSIHFHADLRDVVRDRTAIIYRVVNPKVRGSFVAHDIDGDWTFTCFFGPGQPLDHVPNNDEAHAMVMAAIGADADVTVQRASPWLMAAQVATRYRSGNVFLAGDAAHRFPPNGGLGMNTGLQDVHNLVWKIAAVEAGWAGSSLLDTYESERRGVAVANSEQSLSNALAAPRLSAAMDKASAYVDAPLPLEVEEEFRSALAVNAPTWDNLGLQLGFSYDPERPLPESPDRFVARAQVGDRMPHAWVGPSDARRSTLDMLSSEAFTLFYSGTDQPFIAAARAEFGQVPVDIVTVDPLDVATWGGAADWLELTGLDLGGVLLVRPDGHVLARGLGSPERLISELRSAVGHFLGAVASRDSEEAVRDDKHEIHR